MEKNGGGISGRERSRKRDNQARAAALRGAYRGCCPSALPNPLSPSWLFVPVYTSRGMERQLATTKEEEKQTNTHSMHTACRSEMNARQRDRHSGERTSATVAHFFAFVLSIARVSQPVLVPSIRGNLAWYPRTIKYDKRIFPKDLLHYRPRKKKITPNSTNCHFLVRELMNYITDITDCILLSN